MMVSWARSPNRSILPSRPPGSVSVTCIDSDVSFRASAQSALNGAWMKASNRPAKSCAVQRGDAVARRGQVPVRQFGVGVLVVVGVVADHQDAVTAGRLPAGGQCLLRRLDPPDRFLLERLRVLAQLRASGSSNSRHSRGVAHSSPIVTRSSSSSNPLQ